MIKVYTDGGSRGNPGEAASGVYIIDADGKELAAFGTRLGITTNNIAEYTAVIEAYDWLISHKEVVDQHGEVHFFMDSKLVASQVAGLWKIKHPNIQSLVSSVKEKERFLGIPVTYTHIPRELNKMADKMVNAALDNLL